MQPLKDQLKLTTGKQEAHCPTCESKISVTVSGVKKDGRRKVRHFRGSCRKCQMSYSGVLPLQVWG